VLRSADDRPATSLRLRLWSTWLLLSKRLYLQLWDYKYHYLTELYPTSEI
jgi:hypothetical protein